VVLATGVSDVPPRMPHLADALRQGALRYCPVCDGYEVIGQAVGVIADDGSDTFEALYLRHFSERVTVFPVSDAVRFGAGQREQLQRAGVTLVEQPLASIRLWEGRVTVQHGDAQTQVDSLYCALGMRVHSELATALGAEHDEDGYLGVDRHQQTSVPGLYAAGDVVKGLNQIAVAVGGAAIAASAIHLALAGRA
jgi:thioredoxin reductase (NADPH)